MNSDRCRNNHDIARQTISIEWHVCLVGTTMQILHQLQEFMLETGHALESFPERITDCTCVWTARKKWSSMQKDSEVVIGVSVVQDGNRPGTTTSQDLLLNLATRSGTNSISVMTKELITSKYPVFKCSNMMQTGILTLKKRETRNAFQKRVLLLFV